MVKACVECGANPNIKDVHGRTPLHFAAGTENTELIRYLVQEANADINVTTEGGETALIKAINFGKAEIASQLLDLGANVNIKTYSGDTALSLAEKSQNKRIIQIYEYYNY